MRKIHAVWQFYLLHWMFYLEFQESGGPFENDVSLIFIRSFTGNLISPKLHFARHLLGMFSAGPPGEQKVRQAPFQELTVAS